jgi:hypothetical protein
MAKNEKKMLRQILFTRFDANNGSVTTLARASVSLEVGHGGADLFLLWLIATAPIVDSVGETCALFNHGGFLGKHQSLSSDSDMHSMDSIDPGWKSPLRGMRPLSRRSINGRRRPKACCN